MKEIYARHVVYMYARGRARMACKRTRVLILVYTCMVYIHHGKPANKYNASAWAAIVRTHKVETREKPTVNRRFRS